MTKKYLTPLLASVTLFVAATPLFLTTTRAQKPDVTTQSYPRDGGVLFGQNHYYSVVFRADGGAVVNGRVTLANKLDSDLKTLELDLGKAVTTSFEAFQEINGYIICPLLKISMPVKPCPYETSCTTYKSAEVKQDGPNFTITLPEPIAKDSEGTVVFGYRATGYADKKPLGLFGYTLTTPTVTSSIDTVNVTIDVDSDLYLKSSEGRVVYRGQSDATKTISTQTVQSVAPNIGLGGQISKTGQGLAPGETFRVKGAYATNRWILYWKEFLIVLGVAALLGLAWRWWKKRPAKTEGKQLPGSGENILLSLGGSIGMATLAFVWQQVIPYSSYYGTMGPLLMIGMVFAFLALFFVPAIIAGSRRGWTQSAYVLLLQVAFLFVLLFILTLIGSPSDVPRILPL